MSIDITVLGAGPGGYIAAIRAAQLGARVTVVENDNLGGTCLNWGCIPTKTLKATAEAIHNARRLGEFGIDLDGEARPNFEAIMARKDKVVKTLVAGIAKVFDSYGIRLVQGQGYVNAPDSVTVTGPDGRTEQIRQERLIIATGSRPLSVPAFPLDGDRIISSSDALMLKEAPGELLIVGGGVIGSEFAFILNELGSKVTIVEALDRVMGMPSVDEEISSVLLREMKKKKIKVHLNKTLASTQVLPNGRVRAVLGPSPFLDEASEKDRKEVELEVEKVLVSIGRELNTRGIGLESAGVALAEKGWILANEKMETNLPGVYAIGDVLGPEKIMLAHVASTEALVAVENAMGGAKTMDYSVVPGGIFTLPEMATVGLTEKQACAAGLDCRADVFQFRGLGKSQAMGEIAGLVKLVSDNANDRLLGAHIIGPHATDLIAEAALAMKLKATTRDLAETIHVHPTLSEAILEAAHQAHGGSLHMPAPKK